MFVEFGHQVYPMYWAAEGSATFGEFTIETTSHEIFQDFSQREFTVAKKKVGLVVCKNSFSLFLFGNQLSSVSEARERVGNMRMSLLFSRSDHCVIFTLTSHVVTVMIIIREFKIYDATVAKPSLKITGSSFPIYFAIMSVCLTFES